jgi:hypothetical protein
MIVFLDTAVVIYFIEQPAGWGAKATAHWIRCYVAGHITKRVLCGVPAQAEAHPAQEGHSA